MAICCCGPSSALRCGSLAGEPMTKEPAGTVIMAGQLSHSLKLSFGFSARSRSGGSGPTGATRVGAAAGVGGRGRCARRAARPPAPAPRCGPRLRSCGCRAGNSSANRRKARDIGGALEIAPGDLIGGGSGRRPAPAPPRPAARNRTRRRSASSTPRAAARRRWRASPQADLVEGIERCRDPACGWCPRAPCA